ncbi:hypothetical protein B0H21DRAFT_703152 [Amylocystis lapponica]|nr:hypothetical protein B0H21DRAFT_703152 [Amylocystis lapponica]
MSEPPLPSVASAPFGKPNADIILRSSDLVDFMTFKIVFALASPVFEDMFEIPQPPSSSVAQDIHPENGIPIIFVAENSATLDRILRLFYPVANPVLSNVADTDEALGAAQKYQMTEATAQLSRSLLGFSEVEIYPTYAVACRYGLEDVARAAALVYWRRNKGRQLASREPIFYVPEMDNISAGALYRLLRFCYGATNEQEFKFLPEARTRPATPVIPSPPLASHPFDKPSTKSDLLIQSSDGVHFHVTSLLLALSSPVFAELIDQLPDTPASPGARVITVTEDSHMLLWILHFCYPMEDPIIPSHELEDIMSAGRKYRLVRMTNAAKRMCGDLAITDALRAYLLAMREGWEEVANEMAKHAVYQRHDVYLPEMEDATAKVYYQLLVYRCNCLKVIRNLSAGYYGYSDTLCTTHWSRSALYITSGDLVTSFGSVYEATQSRFGMSTVLASCSRYSGLLAPAVVQNHEGIFGDTLLKTTLEELPLCCRTLTMLYLLCRIRDRVRRARRHRDPARARSDLVEFPGTLHTKLVLGIPNQIWATLPSFTWFIILHMSCLTCRNHESLFLHVLTATIKSMSLPEHSLPSVASAPFDKPNADIILRSSDLVDFRTYKAILALASPVFEDMFDIPQPSSSAQDIHRESDLPIISVAESSVTLDHLLRRCYPMENPVVSNIADTVEVLEAAQKYQMKGATAQLSKSLLGFSQVATYPTYAIACKYGLEDAARAAAHVYWKKNKRCGLASREPIVYVPEMDNISAGALYRLLRFCYGATDKKEFEFHPEARTRPAAPVVPLPPLASSHPFDKPSAKSDLLVQSLDGIHFHVVGLLLALSSPVFAELLDQLPDTPASPGARIITVAEDSHMLLWILHFCYPMEDPEIPSDELENIVSVGRKYHLVRMTNAAKWMCGDLAITDALRAYLLAMREGWEEVANEAAKHAVYQRQDVYLPEMEDVTAEVYVRLLVYR